MGEFYRGRGEPATTRRSTSGKLAPRRGCSSMAEQKLPGYDEGSIPFTRSTLPRPSGAPPARVAGQG